MIAEIGVRDPALKMGRRVWVESQAFAEVVDGKLVLFEPKEARSAVIVKRGFSVQIHGSREISKGILHFSLFESQSPEIEIGSSVFRVEANAVS